MISNDILQRIGMALLLVGLYTNVGVPISILDRPGGLLLCIGVVFLAYQFSHLLSVINGNVRLLLGSVFGLWSINILISPDWTYLVERVRSLAMLFGSTSVFVAVYVYLVSIEKKTFALLFQSLAILVLLGSFLEIHTFFRDFSEYVRSALYDGSFNYASEDRDLEFIGHIRPCLFTQEPSHVAKFLTFCVAAYGLTSDSRFGVLITSILFIAALLVTGSPTVLTGIFLYFFTVCSMHFANSLSGKLAFALIFFIVMLGYLNIQSVAGWLNIARAQAIANNADASTTIRTAGPAEIAKLTIERYPLTGTGLGARELVQDIVVDVYSRNPNIYVQRIIENPGYAGWGNAFFEFFVYGGFGFSALIVITYARLFYEFTGHYVIGLVAFFCVFVSDSGFAAPRVWTYLAIILASIQHRSSRFGKEFLP